MKRYSSELTDTEFKLIEKTFKDQRKRKYELIEIWNAIFYLLKTGCPWRYLSQEYPPWKTVYYYFTKWKREGVIEELQDSLLERERKKHGKESSPSVGVIDSQSVKTSCCAMGRGYDAGKRIKGLKRHIVVDTLGLLMAVVVHTADIQDRDGAKLVLKKLRHKYPRLHIIYADGGYAGKLVEYVANTFNWVLSIIKRNDKKKFVVLPKRWIVERTFAWMDNYRRLSKDYERLNETSVAMMQLAMIRTILKRA